MSLLRLAWRGLLFHRRTHLGTLLGAVLATAILTGALAVGDSVRYSLKEQALARLRGVHLALANPNRFFRTALVDELAPEVPAPLAAVVQLRGAASTSEGESRVGRVQVLGVTAAFWKLGGTTPPPLTAADGTAGAALSDRLAQLLGVKVGDELILRVDKPSLLSRDAPLSKIEDASVALRLPVTAIVDTDHFGRFSLEANQVPPLSVFTQPETLQKAVGLEGRANLLLVGAGVTASAATQALWKHWQLDDAGLKLKTRPGAVELRTDRVFLEPEIARVAQSAQPQTWRALTYFVNGLQAGGRETPYSTVAALEGPLVPAGMRDDQILINQWLADDLGVRVGQALTLRYWLVGPLRKLEEHTSTFTVRAILPLTGPADDPALMPDIPGLTDKKDCRDWEPGVPVDLNKIRDKDQSYWSRYRGTPKAFITLAAGQKIWNNRFGNLTSIRYPVAGPNGRAVVETCLRQALSPASLGLFFQPIRERALAASTQSMDFGGLFLGFSFFLIVAALLLSGLLFAFAIEQRSAELGTLRAVGFPVGLVRRLLLLEGGFLALIGAVVGGLLATSYTRAVVGGLGGVWRGAVADAPLRYHAEPLTLIGGGLGSFLVALAVIAWIVRRQGQQAPQVLLRGGEAVFVGSQKSRWLPGLRTLIGALLCVPGLLAAGANAEGEMAAGLFFGAGAALLVAGIAACRCLLARIERRSGVLTLAGLGRGNAVRRPGRSLGAIALLACGSFLVVAIGANRHDPNEGALRRSSGTGGFALYGESALPLYEDLNSEKGREAFALDSAVLAGSTVVPLRLREGDEASCLNLNRAQTPRLLGVAASALTGRFTFQQSLAGGGGDPWAVLESSDGGDTIPVIGDSNTVTWSLGKTLGSTLDYVDDRGQKHTLKIVGVLANSVLQGALLLSERNFMRLFPDQSGYGVFLVDSPTTKSETVRRELTRGLEDVGMSLVPGPERLAAFNTVENTYLSIFAILGGLGLILGSVGLGVIVLRNVNERRGELALLRAVGFPVATLYRLLFTEHVLLLLLGLAVGIVSALVAVLPSLRAPGAAVPYLSLGLTLLGVLLSGLAWTAAATGLALRGPLLEALRRE